MSDISESLISADYLETTSRSKNAQAQEQEVKDYTEFLKIEYQKYKQYKIILEGIEDVIEDDLLDEDIKEKVRKIISGGSVSQIKLSDNSNEESNDCVLGVALPRTELTYCENHKLVNCLKSKLDDKYDRLKNDFFSVFFKDICDFNDERTEAPVELSHEDNSILELKKKLVAEQEGYVKNQLELLDLLEELKNIRIQTIPEVTNQKIQECNLKSKINYLKSHLAKDKCRLDIFMETTNSLEAYTEVIRDIKEQIENLKKEIEQLKDLKRKYAEVSCKEYNEILKSYLQYKSSFEKKKMMYELYG